MLSHVYTGLNFKTKISGTGEVESATTNSAPSSRPSSTSDSLRLGLVRSSMLATVGIYRVLFFPLMLVVIPGA